MQVIFNEDMIMELYTMVRQWTHEHSNTFHFIMQDIEKNYPDIRHRLGLEDNELWHLHRWSDYINGARQATLKLNEEFVKVKRPSRDKPYIEAEIRYILESKDNMQKWLESKEDDFRYRNHERDKKGKLIYVEAYIP